MRLMGCGRGAARRGAAGARLVADDGGGEADAGAALARGVHAARGELGDVLEELALGDPGVAHQAHVHVAADVEAVGEGPVRRADELQQQGLLDVLHAEDLGRDGVGELGVGVGLPAAPLDLGDEGRAQLVLLVALLGLAHRRRLHVGVGGEAGLDGLVAGVRDRQEDAGDDHLFARGAGARHLAEEVDRHHAGDVPGGDLVRQLLHLQLLKLCEFRCSGLRDELAV